MLELVTTSDDFYILFVSFKNAHVYNNSYRSEKCVFKTRIKKKYSSCKTDSINRTYI